MRDTACGENCCFVKLGVCKSQEQCPNYVESIWKDEKTQEVANIKDCAPKRILLEQQQVVNRQFVLQEALSEMRDKFQRLEYLLTCLISESKTYLDQQKQDTLSIEKK